MKLTTVVNIRYDLFDVYIGRKGIGEDGYFGNPFKRQEGESPGVTIPFYKDYFELRLQNDREFKRRIEELRGKTLGCFCKPKTGFDGEVICHGQVIADYLNKEMS